jgi:hypothetical protein
MDHDHFTEEALKAQDGKKVPLTLEFGGPVVGEATLRYDSDAKALVADMRFDDTKSEALLGGETSAIIFKKES